jgi:hypothetical protein
MPLLKDLSARFVTLVDINPPSMGEIRINSERITMHRQVATLQEAQGLNLLCPACFENNGGAKGTHPITLYFARKSVPESSQYPCWESYGHELDDMSLSPTVILTSCSYTGRVQNGSIERVS